MPVYWQGSTVVGTSGGTTTSGQPINPQGVVEGKNYGGGGSGSSTESKEQLEAKRKMLTSPTAQWTSQESYNQAYQSYLAQGGTPIAKPAGVILTSTPEERRAEASRIEAAQAQAAPWIQQHSAYDYKMGYNPSDIQGITREEYLASRRQADRQAILRREAPIISGLYERTAGISAGLQSGWEGLIGYSERANPLIKFVAGAGSTVTGLPQFVGSGIAGFEIASRMAATKPVKIPEVFAKGLVGMGSEFVATAEQKPIETLGMVTALIAGPRVIKSVGERLPTMTFKKGTAFEMPSAPKTVFELPERVIDMSSPDKMRIEPSVMTGEYGEALARGERLRQTITGSETSFGSPGYRPNSVPKPANQFYTPPKSGGVLPGLLVIPGYDVPNTMALYTAEGLQRLPSIEPKTTLRPVITEVKPATIPEMKLWSEVQVQAQQSVKTMPLLYLPRLKTQPATQQLTQLATHTKIKAQVGVLTQPIIATQLKVQAQPLVQQLTQLATRTATSTKTQTRALTLPGTKVSPLVKPITQPLSKPQTRTKTLNLTALQVNTAVMRQVEVKPLKLSKDLKNTLNVQRKSASRKFGKFPEIARIASSRQILRLSSTKLKRRFKLK